VNIGSCCPARIRSDHREFQILGASGMLRIEVSVVELVDGLLVTGPPKSAAGRRIVSLPPFVLPELDAHLDKFTAPAEDSLVFVGPKNGPLRRGNFTRTWRHATESAGLTGFHFHDLRHTGNHIAAATGASLRELMGRMGHSTTRAALIYQHRTAERDRLIAAAMSEIVQAQLGEVASASGTYRARDRQIRPDSRQARA
jgi:integrase